MTMTAYEKQQTEAWNNQLKELLDLYPLLSWEDIKTWREIKEAIFSEGGTAPSEVLIDCPVFVGEVPLFAPSIGAMHVIEKSEKDFPDSVYHQTLLKAYILHYAKEPATLREFAALPADKKYDKIVEWSTNFTFHVDHLTEAIISLIYGNFPMYPEESKIQYSPPTKNIAFLSALMEKYNQPFDYFYWDHSSQWIHWLGREVASDTHKNDDIINPEKNKMLLLERQFLKAMKEKYSNG